MNKTQQIGRLTRDIELRYTPSNRPVAQFTLAVNRRYAKETDEIKADFFPIVVWGKLAENCKTYLQKGSQIAVEGELRTRNYTDRNGVKKYVTEILANSIEFLGSKKQDSTDTEPLPTPPEPEYTGEQSSLYDNDYAVELSDDDLPF